MAATNGTDRHPAQLKVILAFAAIYIVWGSTFLGVQVALKSFPPFILSTLRFLVAGTALLLFCILRKESFPAPRDIVKHMICGLVIFMGGVVSVVWAQQYLPSSLASIIISTPFWFVVLDKRQWPFYFSSKWIITGLLTGLLGVILLMGSRAGRPGLGGHGMQVISILTIVGGSFLWVCGSLYLKYRPTPTSIYVSTCIQLLTAGLVCSLVSLLRQEPQVFSIDKVQASSVFALLYLSIVSSLLTFMAYIWLIKVRPPVIVSTYSYVNPLVAVLLGWRIAGETISWLQLLALLLILCGVLFVNIPKYRIYREQKLSRQARLVDEQ